MKSGKRQPRARLADLMNQRRLELRLTWDEVARTAGIHRETLRVIRSGSGSLRDLTKSGIENALEWRPGSIDAILEGRDPAVAGAAEHAQARSDKPLYQEGSVHGPLVDRLLRDNPEFRKAWDALEDDEERRELIEKADQLDSRAQNDLVAFARALARPRGETAT